MSRTSTRPGARAWTGPRRPRTATLRVVLAAGAVLAVTAGCSAQVVTDPTGGTNDKPDSGTEAAVEPSTPRETTASARPIAASKPPATPSTQPSKSASETSAPPRTTPKPTPKTVLKTGDQGDQVR